MCDWVLAARAVGASVRKGRAALCQTQPVPAGSTLILILVGSVSNAGGSSETMC